MKLGDRLFDWLKLVGNTFLTTPIGEGLHNTWVALGNTLKPREPGMIIRTLDALFGVNNPASWVAGEIAGLVLGIDTSKLKTDGHARAVELAANPAKFVANLVYDIGNNPIATSIFDPIQEQIMKDVIFPLEQMLDAGTITPLEAVDKMSHTIAGLKGAGMMIGLVGELAGVGQIESISAGIADMAKDMGLPHAMYQLTRPLYEVGFNNYATRYYNKRFRPRRWSASELMGLYALRRIGQNELQAGLAELGYRDSDADHAVRLAEKQVTAGDILAANELQLIDINKTVVMLHENGYSPEAVEFVVNLSSAKRQQDDYNSIASVALSAYKKGLMSEERYRQIRAAAHVPQERVDLEVQIAALSTKQDTTDLHVGNIRTAYMNNVLSGQEADKYLDDLGIDQNARSVLLATWQEQKAPKSLRLNSGTILRAYKQGILDYGETVDKLKDRGWTPEDANIMIGVEDTKGSLPHRTASVATIISAMTSGIIDAQSAYVKLDALGLSPEDAQLQIELATIHPKTTTKSLTDTDVVKLYEVGVFTLDASIAQLVQNGYDEETATLLMIARSSAKARTGVLQELGLNAE